MSFSCTKQPNLMTQNNLQMQFATIPLALPSQQESHTWKVMRSLILANGKHTCLKDQKVIHIGMIRSIICIYVTTH